MRRVAASLLRAASRAAVLRAPTPASFAAHQRVAAATSALRSLATAPPPPAAAPPPPPGAPLAAIVDVTATAQLPALVLSSHERPLLLVFHLANDAASASAMQALGDALAATPDGFRLALVEVNELPEIAERLRVTAVPTVLAMHAEKVTERLSGPQVTPTALQQLVARALALARSAARPAASTGVDAAQLLTAGFDALRALGATAEAQAAGVRTAVQAFSAVLAPEAAAPAAARARALAGLARAALVGSPPDVETAKELVASARQVAVEGLPPAPPGTPDQPPPAEVAAAEAYIALLEDVASSSAESADAAAPSEAETAAAAAHARAVQRFLSGDVDGALDDALWLVRKHRSWRNMAGRALVLRLADALGPDPRAEKARRRLSNLWFA